DENGEVVNGDVLMAIVATHLKENGKLEGNTVVATVMSNLGFHQAMKRAGIDVVETGVGDRYVLEAMKERKAVIGGEQSGHIVLEDRTTGDGLLSAVRLLDIVAATGKPLSELRTVMTEFPQVLQNVRVSDKDGLADASAVWAAVADAERDLGDSGRVLVRASGTEPLVRVMVEAEDEPTARTVATSLSGVVVGALGELS
ncbi:MAG: phosphoglucosamine mutase, partial [Acidimicrobiia bacterium]|nr:phosphoglucosamine mutase [Acidimicrobiia bacterium]